MSSIVEKLNDLSKLHHDLESKLNDIETDLDSMGEDIHTASESFISQDTFAQFRDELEARLHFEGAVAAANFAIVAVRTLDRNGTFNINLPLDVVA